jgi:hypothetical protein
MKVLLYWKVFLYLVIIIISLILLLYIIGVFLPKERSEQRTILYKSSPQAVYEAVINNRDFSYRSDLKALQIIDDNAGFQTWKEISKTGQEITFRATKKEPYSRYEFEIVEAKGFKGYWIGEFNKTEVDGTEFISTEHIVIESPIIRVFSYLFFDLGKFMDSYQKDLANKLNE